MLRANLLPPVPQELAGQNVTVEYLSPLVKQQKAADSKAFIQTFSTAAQLLQIDPNVLDVFDLDKAIKGIAEDSGVPTKWLRSEEELAQLKAQKEQAQQQAQQMQMAQQMAQTEAELTKAGVLPKADGNSNK